jgi:hypothetical protein
VDDRWIKAAFWARAVVVGTVQVSAGTAAVGFLGYWVFVGLREYVHFLIAKSGNNAPGWFIGSGVFGFFCGCAVVEHYKSLIRRMDAESKCDYVEKTHWWPFGTKPRT